MANTYKQVVGTLVRVTKHGRTYHASVPDGTLVEGIENYALRNAYKSGSALKLTQAANGKVQWRKVPLSEWTKLTPKSEREDIGFMTATSTPQNHDEFITFLRNASSLKPHRLKMAELKWRYIVRCAMKGDNLMFLGPSGCGKTMSVYAVSHVLNRPFYYFNMGATQDPRGALIGNTHFSPEKGTYVAESKFIQAIQEENAIILLDEISRAHPDASNILMTVLDKAQRYLRIDEKPGSPVIKVNKTVSFFLTANVGSEYTGTRTMDRALFDRCKVVEVEPLSLDDELELLTESYPTADSKILRAIAEIACETRAEVRSESPKVDTIISTRVTLEMADMINDSFTLEEAAEICIYPFFSEAGGQDSPRSFMKKVVQKHLPVAKNTKEKVTTEDNGDNKTPW